jgi:2'-5' RNA ligase
VSSALGALARDVAARARGRAVAAANIHLTLAFLGDTPKSSVPALEAIGAALPLEGFGLVLDHVGGFRASGVAWVGAASIPPPLDVLQAALARALAAGGFPVDARPFRAHVTVARKCGSVLREKLAAPVEWRVDALTLVASTLAPGGSVYRPLASWALPAPPGQDATGTV